MDFLKKYFGNKSQSKMTQYKIPFKRDGFESMSIHVYRGLFKSNRDSIHISGSIKFKNDLTEGEQKFKADSLDGVIKQMHSFMESLEK